MPIYPDLIEDPGRYMHIANMPDWQADCVRDAV